MTIFSTRKERSMDSSMTGDTYVNQDGCRLSGDFSVLRQTPLFTGVHHDVVKLFAYLSTRRRFQANDYLINQGKRATQAFLLLKGAVDITVCHRDKEIVLQQLEEGTIFGELALLAQFNWFFNARAAEEAEVIMIEQTAFKKVIEKYPEEKDTLTERIIKIRIDRMENQTAFMLDQLLSDGWQPNEVMV